MNVKSINITALIGLILVSASGVADAHAFSAPTLATVAGSDAIYVIKVTSHESGPWLGSISVLVTETLRGDSAKTLTLSEYSELPVNTEWLIFHHPNGFKGVVGWAIAGDCEWLPISLTRKDDKLVAEWIGPMDQVRDYLRTHPLK